MDNPQLDTHRHIHMVDAHGVAFAALQALYDQIIALETEVATLRREKSVTSST